MVNNFFYSLLSLLALGVGLCKRAGRKNRSASRSALLEVHRACWYLNAGGLQCQIRRVLLPLWIQSQIRKVNLTANQATGLPMRIVIKSDLFRLRFSVINGRDLIAKEEFEHTKDLLLLFWFFMVLLLPIFEISSSTQQSAQKFFLLSGASAFGFAGSSDTEWMQKIDFCHFRIDCKDLPSQPLNGKGFICGLLPLPLLA